MVFYFFIFYLFIYFFFEIQIVSLKKVVFVYMFSGNPGENKGFCRKDPGNLGLKFEQKVWKSNQLYGRRAQLMGNSRL